MKSAAGIPSANTRKHVEMETQLFFLKTQF